MDYEQRIWNDGTEYRWEIRHKGVLSEAFASGHAETRRQAQAAIDRRIDAEQKRNAAPWRKVKRK